MLHNFPRGYTRKELITELDQGGFAGLYDFVYIPRCRRKFHGFVNLTAEEQLPRFVEKFDGYLPHPSSKMAWRVTQSYTQGLAANIERFQSGSAAADGVPECFRPALFVGGKQAPFPEPTCEAPPVQLRTRVQ